VTAIHPCESVYTMPATKRFTLQATVSTASGTLVGPVLERLLGKASVKPQSKGEFEIAATMTGTSAKDLNRELLSALRRAEKRTRLRATWTSGKTMERYFDYVLKMRANAASK
jgi:hypothetical protein